MERYLLDERESKKALTDARIKAQRQLYIDENKYQKTFAGSKGYKFDADMSQIGLNIELGKSHKAGEYDGFDLQPVKRDEKTGQRLFNVNIHDIQDWTDINGGVRKKDFEFSG